MVFNAASEEMVKVPLININVGIGLFEVPETVENKTWDSYLHVA